MVNPLELSNTPTEEFEHYNNFFAEVNGAHPQRQGLSQDEYSRSIVSSESVLSRLAIDNTEVRLPQLVPVSHFEWLNQGRYAKEFPEETESGNVMHFTDFDGVEPSPEVLERLQELARAKGVIVFDYALTNPGYLVKLDALMDQIGITREPIRILATQNYYAGRTFLKNGETGNNTPEDILDTAEKYGRVGMRDNGTAIVRSVSEEDAELMSEFYTAAYEELQSTEFCNQALDPEEFMHVMTQELDVPKVVNIKDGRIVSLMLLEKDLTKLSWINPDYYRIRYPQEYDNQQVMWFPGLAADPTFKGLQNTQSMVGFVTELMELAGNPFIVVFDCGIINSGRLNTFLERTINKTPQVGISIENIAQQNYCAVKLLG